MGLTYGASPPFTERKAQRFPWGKVEVSYDIRQGSVVECHFYGDFFMAGPGKSLTDEYEQLRDLRSGRGHARRSLHERGPFTRA